MSALYPCRSRRKRIKEGHHWTCRCPVSVPYRRSTSNISGTWELPLQCPFRSSWITSFGVFSPVTITALIGHRLTVESTSYGTARALSESASRTLLPADIGMLLADDWIVLDFSTRPFDPIELDRMIALAQQLSQMI